MMPNFTFVLHYFFSVLINYHYISVGYYDAGFFAHQERVEAYVVEAQIHPALAWHSVLRKATGIVFQMSFKIKKKIVSLFSNRLPLKFAATVTVATLIFSNIFVAKIKNLKKYTGIGNSTFFGNHGYQKISFCRLQYNSG